MSYLDRRAKDRRKVDVGPLLKERRAKERRFRWVNFKENLLWPGLAGIVSVGLILYYLFS